MGIIYPYTSDFFGIAGLLGIIGEPHELLNAHAMSRKSQISGMTQPIMEYASSKYGSTDIWPLITGLGFGSAEYSTTSLFLSDFFIRYNNLGYASFLLSFLYVETGAVGIVVFCSMWIYIIIKGALCIFNDRSEGIIELLCGFAFLVVTFYNHTLRTNYGYIMWIFLGAVWVMIRDARKESADGQDERKVD